MAYHMGEIIGENRKNQGMTQEEFASRLGVTAQAVSKWERGLGIPDAGLLAGICTILHIDANVLLGVETNAIVENHDRGMEKEIKANMFAEPLVVEFGKELLACFAEGMQTDIINRKRCELVKRTGMLIPLLRVRDNFELKEREVVVKAYDEAIYREELRTIDDSPYEYLMERIFAECEKNYALIINKQIVKTLIDNLKERYPGVVDGLVPEKISYLQVLEHLRKRLDERGNIRDMIHILEELETTL